MFDLSLTSLIAKIPALLIGFAFHELAHAWVADRLGDPTARHQGRITLNPFAHLDPLGTILLLVAGFGWAKPVPVNPYNFTRKVTMRTGMMLVSLAGPLTNLIIAFISAFLLLWVQTLNFSSNLIVANIFYYMLVINLVLFAFNLIPIPPLDGYKVLSGLLPAKYDRYIDQIEQYSNVLLLLLILSGITGMVIGPIVSIFSGLFMDIAESILGIFLR